MGKSNKHQPPPNPHVITTDVGALYSAEEFALQVDAVNVPVQPLPTWEAPIDGRSLFRNQMLLPLTSVEWMLPSELWTGNTFHVVQHPLSENASVSSMLSCDVPSLFVNKCFTELDHLNFNRGNIPEFVWELIEPVQEDSDTPTGDVNYFHVKVFVDGQWRRVIVDDQVPVDRATGRILLPYDKGVPAPLNNSDGASEEAQTDAKLSSAKTSKQGKTNKQTSSKKDKNKSTTEVEPAKPVEEAVAASEDDSIIQSDGKGSPECFQMDLWPILIFKAVLAVHRNKARQLHLHDDRSLSLLHILTGWVPEQLNASTSEGDASQDAFFETCTGCPSFHHNLDWDSTNPPDPSNYHFKSWDEYDQAYETCREQQDEEGLKLLEEAKETAIELRKLQWQRKQFSSGHKKKTGKRTKKSKFPVNVMALRAEEQRLKGLRAELVKRLHSARSDIFRLVVVDADLSCCQDRLLSRDQVSQGVEPDNAESSNDDDANYANDDDANYANGDVTDQVSDEATDQANDGPTEQANDGPTDQENDGPTEHTNTTSTDEQQDGETLNHSDPRTQHDDTSDSTNSTEQGQAVPDDSTSTGQDIPDEAVPSFPLSAIVSISLDDPHSDTTASWNLAQGSSVIVVESRGFDANDWEIRLTGRDCLTGLHVDAWLNGTCVAGLVNDGLLQLERWVQPAFDGRSESKTLDREWVWEYPQDAERAEEAQQQTNKKASKKKSGNDATAAPGSADLGKVLAGEEPTPKVITTIPGETFSCFVVDLPDETVEGTEDGARGSCNEDSEMIQVLFVCQASAQGGQGDAGSNATFDLIKHDCGLWDSPNNVYNEDSCSSLDRVIAKWGVGSSSVVARRVMVKRGENYAIKFHSALGGKVVAHCSSSFRFLETPKDVWAATCDSEANQMSMRTETGKFPAVDRQRKREVFRFIVHGADGEDANEQRLNAFVSFADARIEELCDLFWVDSKGGLVEKVKEQDGQGKLWLSNRAVPPASKFALICLIRAQSRPIASGAWNVTLVGDLNLETQVRRVEYGMNHCGYQGSYLANHSFRLFRFPLPASSFIENLSLQLDVSLPNAASAIPPAVTLDVVKCSKLYQASGVLGKGDSTMYSSFDEAGQTMLCVPASVASSLDDDGDEYLALEGRIVIQDPERDRSSWYTAKPYWDPEQMDPVPENDKLGEEASAVVGDGNDQELSWRLTTLSEEDMQLTRDKHWEEAKAAIVDKWNSREEHRDQLAKSTRLRFRGEHELAAEVLPSGDPFTTVVKQDPEDVVAIKQQRQVFLDQLSEEKDNDSMVTHGGPVTRKMTQEDALARIAKLEQQVNDVNVERESVLEAREVAKTETRPAQLNAQKAAMQEMYKAEGEELLQAHIGNLEEWFQTVHGSSAS